jgi:large subunit ribosomal protein L15
MVDSRKGGKSPARKPARKRAARPAAAREAESPRKGTPRKAAPEPVARTAKPATGLHQVQPARGATHSRKRVGRGPGSGHGKTAGRGSKGQKSRAGYRHLRGFEGGQMPLHRRVPKRGFTNIFRVEYNAVNLRDLARFEAGQSVTPEALRERGLAGRGPVKILGEGQIQKKLSVSAHKFSASARAKIEAAGGSCEVVK